jgi:peptidoglycan hydrolase-like protein with peptidoglycan-binding domain
VRAPRVPPRTPRETIERRRGILVLGALAVGLVVVIVVVVVATGGGGGSSPTAVATTSPTTQPASTPTTTPTTTSQQTTPPSLHVTVPDSGSLSSGDSGPEVVTLQKALTQLGFDAGTADGDFGSTTETAVIAFQQAHNLKPDGIVGTETAKAMNDALAAASG